MKNAVYNVIYFDFITLNFFETFLDVFCFVKYTFFDLEYIILKRFKTTYFILVLLYNYMWVLSCTYTMYTPYRYILVNIPILRTNTDGIMELDTIII